MPLEDIAVLIAGSQWMTLTQSVLSELAEQGGVVVIANSRGLPVSMSLPLYGHSLQGQKLAIQCSAPAPRKKRIWQQLVIAKIRHQSLVLTSLHGGDGGLAQLVKRVRSGDPDNVEAQAARRYWPQLFQSASFRRKPGEGEPPNHLLDYGYAVLRAIIARAICGSGLQPMMGVQHHERDNSYALADDLIEPYRPIVDHAVALLVRTGSGNAPLNRDTKQKLIQPLLRRFHYEGELRTLFDLAASLSSCLLRNLQGTEEPLPIAEILSGE